MSFDDCTLGKYLLCINHGSKEYTLNSFLHGILHLFGKTGELYGIFFTAIYLTLIWLNILNLMKSPQHIFMHFNSGPLMTTQYSFDITINFPW